MKTCKVRKPQRPGRLGFFFRSLTSLKSTGTFFPTSKVFARKVAELAMEENKGSGTMVELGAGTGSVTWELLDKLPHGRKLIAVDVLEKFRKPLEKIRRQYPKKNFEIVILRKGEGAESYIKDAQCVVSGVPLSSSEKVAREVLAMCQNAPRFVQYKYFGSENLLSEYFSHVETMRDKLSPHVMYLCNNHGLKTK